MLHLLRREPFETIQMNILYQTLDRLCKMLPIPGVHIDKGGYNIPPGLKSKFFNTPWYILTIFCLVVQSSTMYCRFPMHSSEFCPLIQNSYFCMTFFLLSWFNLIFHVAMCSNEYFPEKLKIIQLADLIQIR